MLLCITSLPMELKRIEDLAWDELPRVEIPFFARSCVRDDCWTDIYSSTILGLRSVLSDYASRDWCSHNGPSSMRSAVPWLLEQIEDGNYILVYGQFNSGSIMDSVLRWDPQGGSQRPDTSAPKTAAVHPGDRPVTSPNSPTPALHGNAANSRQQLGLGGQKMGDHPEIDPGELKNADIPAGCWVANPDLPMLMRYRIEQCLQKARRSDLAAQREPECLWWGGLLEDRRWKSRVLYRPLKSDGATAAELPTPSLANTPSQIQNQSNSGSYGIANSIASTKMDCDTAYEMQMEICSMSPTPLARSLCRQRAMDLYSDCLRSASS